VKGALAGHRASAFSRSLTASCIWSRCRCRSDCRRPTCSAR
jgi:hypothetical protein